MLSRIESSTSDRKNRSFVSQKIEILPQVTFKLPIEPCDHLIFIHLPKTGGTNLYYVTEALSKQMQNFKSNRIHVPRIPNQPTCCITENWIGALESAESIMRGDNEYYKDSNFISGHFPFGLHNALDSSSKYITLIRNPVERTVSSTNFGYQRGQVSLIQAENYLLSAEIDNPQTRLLAGREYMSGICSTRALEQAKENISNHFLLAGITDDTNTFIQVLASIQNWGSLALARNQVTGDKVITTLTSELLDNITKKHQYDLLLYTWVKNRWQKWKERYLNETLNVLSEKVLCITSDFANTRQPKFLTESEIYTYNNGITEELVETSQNHSKLQKNKVNNSSVGFFGLKNTNGNPMDLNCARHFCGYF